MDVELLNRIDAAIADLCPCGAEPRDGSAYCSYDCEPTHITSETQLPGVMLTALVAMTVDNRIGAFAVTGPLAGAAQAIEELARSTLPALQEFGERVRQSFPGHVWTTDRQRDAEPSAPKHPMLAAIERRRNRNTGPVQRQRAPREINPRRR